jgi:hypothetical protein
MQFTPYRPWSVERKAAWRAATGREIVSNEPKREYCGPYLIALPAPSWWGKYVPTVPPYRIRVTRLSDGVEVAIRDNFTDQRVAIASAWLVPTGHAAEVLDAVGDWIMRVRIDAAVQHI